MKPTLSRGPRSLLLVVALLVWASPRQASAHLMVAQRGTLHVIDRGAFLLLSLPVSAFAHVDDDGDGLLSLRELQRHDAQLRAEVLAGVQLRDGDANLPLQGLLLNLSPPGEVPDAPADQLVVMGRFAIAAPQRPLRLRLQLYGRGEDERTTTITASRGDDTQLLVFSPERTTFALFPSAGQTVRGALELGITHVLGGLDHLLFLLVVVIAGWRVRQLIWVLSCFTLGHACTLLAAVALGLRLSPAVVEPAIAATIVAMALFDWRHRHAAAAAGPRRMALVFACALIHGLGLAGALTGLGLRGDNRLEVLLGFNVGIELAQLGLALVAVLLLQVLRRLAGPGVVGRATQLAWLGAVAVGSAWFVERVLAGA